MCHSFFVLHLYCKSITEIGFADSQQRTKINGTQAVLLHILL